MKTNLKPGDVVVIEWSHFKEFVDEIGVVYKVYDPIHEITQIEVRWRFGYRFAYTNSLTHIGEL